MVRTIFAAMALSLLASGNAFGEFRCTVTVAVSPQVELVSSIAKAQALLFGNQDNSVNMIIRPHTLNPGGRTAVRSGPGEVAFLARDRNGNGSIDTGAELFGNATPLVSGGRAANGFVALAELDGNGDAVLDHDDAVWPSLWLWIDRNHDGVSSPAELQSVQSSNVRWIGVAFEVVNRRDSWGNTFRFMSRFGMRSGSGHGGTRLFYDVLLTR